MKKSLGSIVLVLATVALAACDGKVLYGQADEPSIVFTQPLGTTLPGDPTQTQMTVPQGVVTFTFDIPDVPLSGGSTATNQMGFAIATMMRLNQAAFTIPPAFTNADFDGSTR